MKLYQLIIAFLTFYCLPAVSLLATEEETENTLEEKILEEIIAEEQIAGIGGMMYWKFIVANTLFPGSLAWLVLFSVKSEYKLHFFTTTLILFLGSLIASCLYAYMFEFIKKTIVRVVVANIIYVAIEVLSLLIVFDTLCSKIDSVTKAVDGIVLSNHYGLEKKEVISFALCYLGVKVLLYLGSLVDKYSLDRVNEAVAR